MASVAPSCKIVAAPEVVFGVYDSTGPNAALPIGVGSYISVVCTRGSSGIQINLNEGANNVPGSPAHNPGRRMKSGNQYLNYQVHWAPSRAGGCSSYEHQIRAAKLCIVRPGGLAAPSSMPEDNDESDDLLPGLNAGEEVISPVCLYHYSWALLCLPVAPACIY